MSHFSVIRGINDNGLVVGVSEYELTTSDQRRKHGFMYDINTVIAFIYSCPD